MSLGGSASWTPTFRGWEMPRARTGVAPLTLNWSLSGVVPGVCGSQRVRGSCPRTKPCFMWLRGTSGNPQGCPRAAEGPQSRTHDAQGLALTTLPILIPL